ncbi:hypothetical protein DIPPA_08798 [Diplonema papillatum]|nr:hypothetical protein DIPPA_08798 [Diplonema papillatum]
MFCGECGEPVSSDTCCKKKRQAALSQTLPTPLAAPARTAHVPVPVFARDANQEEIDSDHEEEDEELYVKGQPVSTLHGKGTILSRMEGGGVLAWFVKLDKGGIRLMDADDLFNTPPASTAKVIHAVESPLSIAGKRKRDASDTSPVIGHSPVGRFAPPARRPLGAPVPVARGAVPYKMELRTAPRIIKSKLPTTLSGHTGVVNKWFEEKGYGFVSARDGLPDIWVSRKVCEGGYLVPGQEVMVDAEDSGHMSGRLVCTAISGVGLRRKRGHD